MLFFLKSSPTVSNLKAPAKEDFVSTQIDASEIDTILLKPCQKVANNIFKLFES